ncbi:MAG: hypothetical protein K9L87_03275 [Candidatus Omnitrophica bacterium]|nr:hypothetical protein [Candidatus Omnitrophota bacterium]MCF7909784.1 hypothetical protein [Candidatus Omnitrophota bacterium]
MGKYIKDFLNWFKYGIKVGWAIFIFIIGLTLSFAIPLGTSVGSYIIGYHMPYADTIVTIERLYKEYPSFKKDIDKAVANNYTPSEICSIIKKRESGINFHCLFQKRFPIAYRFRHLLKIATWIGYIISFILFVGLILSIGRINFKYLINRIKNVPK